MGQKIFSAHVGSVSHLVAGRPQTFWTADRAYSEPEIASLLNQAFEMGWRQGRDRSVRAVMNEAGFQAKKKRSRK